MRLFLGKPTKEKPASIILDKAESNHLAKVLRLDIGDQVECIDGKGNRYISEVILNHPKASELKILEKIHENLVFNIHLAVAPTKNLSRWEWFLEKAVELGIDRITPIITVHSERKVLKRERQERIIVSAAKQSRKAKFPLLDDLMPLMTFLDQQLEGQKMVAHCADDPSKKGLKQVYQMHQNAIILIGPEGDFSTEELQVLREHDFDSISLGSSRLRTETAALIACHSIHLLNA